MPPTQELKSSTQCSETGPDIDVIILQETRIPIEFSNQRRNKLARSKRRKRLRCLCSADISPKAHDCFQTESFAKISFM